MKTCTWGFMVGTDEPCGELCEGRTEFCASHNRQLRREEAEAKKQVEKRNTLIAKQRAKNQVPRKRVNPVSEKRKEDNIQYSFERARFLAVNTVCQINANEYCTGVATTIHHTAGRIGGFIFRRDQMERGVHVNAINTWRRTRKKRKSADGVRAD